MYFQWKQWFIDSHYIGTQPYFICTRTWAWFPLNRAFVFCFMVGYKGSLLFLRSIPRGNVDKNANYMRKIFLLRHTHIVNIFKCYLYALGLKKNHFSSRPIRLSQDVAGVVHKVQWKRWIANIKAFLFDAEQLTNSWSDSLAFRCLYLVILTYFTTGYTSSEQDC